MSDAKALEHWAALGARPYAPTHDFEGTFLDGDHAAIAQIPTQGVVLQSDIAGWLQIDDALKLYELAYLSSGDVLELGTYQGLSTSFIALALLNAGRGHSCDSVELDAGVSRAAYRNLDARGLNCVVTLHVSDAAVACRRLRSLGKRYAFAFVDHSHGYEDVLAANEELKHLVQPGGYLLFHDYTDPRNSTRVGVGDHPDEFGVRHACDTAFADGSFVFVATCGACGIYQRALPAGE